MIVQTFILFIALFSCQEQKIKTKTAIKPKITKVVSAKRPTINEIYFSEELKEIAVFDIFGKKMNVSYSLNSTDISAFLKVFV